METAVRLASGSHLFAFIIYHLSFSVF